LIDIVEGNVSYTAPADFGSDRLIAIGVMLGLIILPFLIGVIYTRHLLRKQQNSLVLKDQSRESLEDGSIGARISESVAPDPLLQRLDDIKSNEIFRAWADEINYRLGLVRPQRSSSFRRKSRQATFGPSRQQTAEQE
jgi:hypothetical protein